jgi:hypothetical protein
MVILGIKQLLSSEAPINMDRYIQCKCTCYGRIATRAEMEELIKAER